MYWSVGPDETFELVTNRAFTPPADEGIEDDFIATVSIPEEMRMV